MKKIQISEEQLSMIVEKMSIRELDAKTYRSAAKKLDALGHKKRAKKITQYVSKLNSLGEFELRRIANGKETENILNLSFTGFDTYLTIENYFGEGEFIDYIYIFPYFTFEDEETIVPFQIKFSLSDGIKITGGFDNRNGRDAFYLFGNRSDAVRFVKAYKENVIKSFEGVKNHYKGIEYYSEEGLDFILDLITLSLNYIKPNLFYRD
jgi:hypothetical protein